MGKVAHMGDCGCSTTKSAGIAGLGAVEVLNQNIRVVDTSGLRPTYEQLDNYDTLIVEDDDFRLQLSGTDLDATIKHIQAVIRKYRYQVADLAEHLKGDTLEQSLYNIWHFIETNIKYRFDTVGLEEIRTPARTWADRFEGVDCEDYSIFGASLVLNMGYKPTLEVVAFEGSPAYKHIFFTVAGFVIDNVLNEFNKRPNNISRTMEIQLLGSVNQFNQLTTLYNDLVVRANNAGGQELRELHREIRKVAFLMEFAGYSDYPVIARLMPYVEDVRNGTPVFRRDLTPGEARKAQEIAAQSGNGLEGLGGILDKIKQIAQGAVTTVKNVIKDPIAAAKSLPKTVLHIISKTTGLGLAARTGFILALKKNWFKLGEKLGPGYWGEAAAQGQVKDMGQWRKLSNTVIPQVETLWYAAGGNVDDLRKAAAEGNPIKNTASKRDKMNVNDRAGTYEAQDNTNSGASKRDKMSVINRAGLRGTGLGEAVAAGTVAAASTLIASVALLLKQINFSVMGLGGGNEDCLNNIIAREEAGEQITQADLDACEDTGAFDQGGYSPGDPDFDFDDDDDDETDNTWLWIGGAAVAGLGLYALTSSNNSGKRKRR